jgi:hypothetical protein
MFSSTNVCLFSSIYTKFDTVPLSDPLRNCIRPDILLQIKDVKNQYIDSDALHFVHLLLRYDSTIIYHFIRLLKLLTDGSTSPGNYGHPPPYIAEDGLFSFQAC